tara:strand:+ start:374 stop:1339 length:966 start_codon:yes stop_codon:yes gene_type:complete
MKVRLPQTLLGSGDDCAVLKLSAGTMLVSSCDSLIEGIHFELPLTPFLKLGRKAISVNLSDIAAMGSIPKWLLISLAIPQSIKLCDIEALYKGMEQICKKYQIEVAGGDTVGSPEGFGLHITILGETPKKRWFTRSAARPGDAIFVTGTLGDSALGLNILKYGNRWKGSKKDKNYLIERHLNPTPRLEESRLLTNMANSMGAMIDISDGLLKDLGHICRASGTGAELNEKLLPKSQPFESISKKNSCSNLDLILSGGEDYELLFTFRPQSVKKLMYQFQRAGKYLTQIGIITGKKNRLVLTKSGGSPPVICNPEGFDHFTR